MGMGAMWVRIVGALAASVIAAGHAYAADADIVTKAPPPQAAPVWTWIYNNETQYVSWTSNRGNPTSFTGPPAGSARGSQFYDPFGVTMSGAPVSNWNVNVTARGGYVYGSQTIGGLSGSVSTATDTTLSGTATYTGFSGWQPYVTLMANLPTGESVLVGTHTFARMDPDMVPVAAYGEGFNIGPTLGVNIPFNSEFTLVLNGGETWRGPFWKEGFFQGLPTLTSTPSQLINPSQMWTGAATAVWTHGAISLQGTASYAVESTSYINHALAYRAGPRTTISGSGSYRWDQSQTTSIDGYFVHSDRNDVPSAVVPGVLVPEVLDSNNDVFRINVGHMYMTPYNGGTLTVGPIGSFMYRDRNSYDPTTFSFEPAKTRYSAGASAGYSPNNKFNVNARVEHIWIDEAAQPTPFLIPTVNGQGWQASLAMTLSTP
jgi:hypothetical protein